MNDLEVLGMSLSDFCKQSFSRIEGIAMYVVCTMIIVFAGYSVLADAFALPLTSEWKRLHGAWLLLFVPITFIIYVSLTVYSSTSKSSRVINAIILLGIPVYFIYKIYN